MKNRIQKIINDQLGEHGEYVEDWLVSIAESAYAEPLKRQLHEKEIQNRELLASLIEAEYGVDWYRGQLEELCDTEGFDYYDFVTNSKTKELIEKTLSLSWSEIVKRLEA